MSPATDRYAPRPAASTAIDGLRTIAAIRSIDAGIQGPENLILCLAAELPRLGVRYVIVCLWDGTPPTVALHEEARRRGLESHVVVSNSDLDPAVLPRLAVTLRRLRPDVIHTHDAKSDLAALALRPLVRAPMVSSYYGQLAINSLFLRLEDWGRMAGFQLVAHVFANSTAQRGELGRWLLPERRSSVLPSFVDTAAITPATPAERAAARQELDIARDRPVIATVARLSKNKGHTYMLQALPQLLEAHPDLLYLVPGEGDSAWHGDGGLRAVLEQEATILGLGDRVRFLGYYPHVATILAAADLVVSPSLREGMQVSLLEAMAAGLPVVATAVGGTTDAVAHGETGLLVPPASPDALAGAVGRLLADRPLMASMGAAARARAEREFDACAVAGQLAAVCAEVVHRG